MEIDEVTMEDVAGQPMIIQELLIGSRQIAPGVYQINFPSLPLSTIWQGRLTRSRKVNIDDVFIGPSGRRVINDLGDDIILCRRGYERYLRPHEYVDIGWLNEIQ